MAIPLQRSGGERLSHPRRQPGTVPAEIQGASMSPYGLPGVSACSRWPCRGWPGQHFIQPKAMLAGMGPVHPEFEFLSLVYFAVVIASKSGLRERRKLDNKHQYHVAR
ncbi:hypothetical protein MHYP_G00151450 [Metynnis hypsauchen]